MGYGKRQICNHTWLIKTIIKNKPLPTTTYFCPKCGQEKTVVGNPTSVYRVTTSNFNQQPS